MKKMCVFAPLVACALGGHALEVSPTHWYKFEAIANGTVADEATQAIAGRVIGNPDLSTGRDGRAMTFSGNAGTYVDLGDMALLKSTDFTVETWINPSSTSKGTILAQTMPDGSNWQFYYEHYQLKFQFDYGPDWFNLGSVTFIPSNTWTHVALVRDEGVYKIFVNGIPMYARDGEHRLPDAGNATIGATLEGGTGRDAFNGSIDEMRIYDRALTDKEIGIVAGRVSPYHTNLTVENGKITVAFAEKQEKAPAVADFDAFIKVNDDIKVALKVTAVDYDKGSNTAVLSFKPLAPAAVEQKAAIEVLFHKFPSYAELVVPSGNVAAPSVSDLAIHAKALRTREILSADYLYNDPAGIEEYDSRYEWYVSDSPSGGFTLIKGVHSKTMMALQAHNGKYIKVAVTPRNHRYAQGQRIESPVVGPIVEEKNNPRTDWMAGKYGISCHFLPNYLSLSPTIPENEKWQEGESWDDFLKTFDVEKFAAEVNEVGAAFLLLTINQHGGYNLCPNAVYDSICGAEPGEKSSIRDLSMEIADALKPYGIKLMLYYMGTLPSKASMDYYDGLNEHSPDRWGDYLLTYSMDTYPFSDVFTVDNRRKFEMIISEFGRRYGDKVAGFWFDGLYDGYYSNLDNPYNENSIVHAARLGNPDRVVTGAGLGHREVMDYPHGEAEDIVSLPSSRWANGNTYQQWFRWNPLGNHNINAGWGVPVDPDGRIFDTDNLAQWARRATNNGGCASFDIRVNRFGELDAYGKQQLLAVKEAVQTNAVKPDACGSIRLIPLDAKVEGGPALSPSENPDHVGNWWDNGGSAAWNFLLDEGGKSYTLNMETASVGTPMTATLEVTGPDGNVVLSKEVTFPDGSQYVETAFGELKCDQAGVYVLKLTKKSGDATDLRLIRLLPVGMEPVEKEMLIDDFEEGNKSWGNIGDITFEVVDNPTGGNDCLNTSAKVMKFQRTGNGGTDWDGIILSGLDMPFGTSPDCSYRYVHLMIKKPTAHKVGVKVEGNGDYERAVDFEASSHWVDVVVDLAQAGNKAFPTIFIQPDKNADANEPVYIDNIRLSNDPEPLFCDNLTVVQPDENGKITLLPSDSKVSGGICVEGDPSMLNFGCWASAGVGPVSGEIVWMFKTGQAGTYDVYANMQAAVTNSSMDFDIDGEVTTLPCAKGDQYDTQYLGTLSIGQGEHRLMLTRTSDTPDWHYINLLSLTFVPQRTTGAPLTGQDSGMISACVRDGELFVSGLEAGNRVSLYDTAGNCLVERLAGGSEMRLPVSYRGVALLQVNAGQELTWGQKVIF